jgi:alkanesulfonate monooxygenase SsuD/methylene tetrahydromethanopterin reductase-like flavin-dependent oxidoreductase (luciferase family)
MKVRFAVSAGLGEPDPDQLDQLVTLAEAKGFDSLWFSDVPMLPATDPLLAVASAAARSVRLKLGVNLVPFGYEPFVLARQVAQLDRLTRGRLLVTLVPGLDQPGERSALGIGGAHRGRAFDVLIPDLRTWWAGGAVPRPGPDGGEQPVALPVRPHQDPLELWLGGSGPEAIRRAGRLADGWLGSLTGGPTEVGAIRARIVAEATAAGRVIDPEHFGLSIPYARTAGDLVAAGRVPRPRVADIGPLIPVGADGLRALVGDLIDEGLSKFVVRPLRPIDSWADELDWLADVVLDLHT